MRRAIPLALLLTIVAGIVWTVSRSTSSGRDEQTADAVPAETPVDTRVALAAGNAADSPLRAEILELRRVSRDVIELSVRLVNRDPARAVELAPAGPDAEEWLATTSLVTGQGDVRYFVLRDAAGEPACTRAVTSLAPGEHRVVSVRFASPGAAETRVSVQLTGLPAISGLSLAAAS